jgi:hypothetical protein
MTVALAKSAPPSEAWITRIENDDSAAVWRALHRLVAVHPLVRSAQRRPDGLAHAGALSSLGDLTQDLYLRLLEKARFAHYLASRMSDAEIEREILQVELRNMLVARLRRQRPENYRLVRRIGDMLEADARFCACAPARGRGATNTLYALREWGGAKPAKDSGTFAALVAAVPARLRNRRRVGCRGEAQVIITNQELGELLRDLLRAIDSPATLRVLRALALAKLPVYDVVMTSIEERAEDVGQARGRAPLTAAAGASPEQLALRREQETAARRTAAEFLDRLRLLVGSHPERTERLWRVLWHCYFDPAGPSQIRIAGIIGISDSSVSDYRRRLEAEIRKLGFTPEQLAAFAEELDAGLRRRLGPGRAGEGEPGRGGDKAAGRFFTPVSPSLPPSLSGIVSPSGL